MKCFRFDVAGGFIYAGGSDDKEARNKAARINKNITGGVRAGYTNLDAVFRRF